MKSARGPWREEIQASNIRSILRPALIEYLEAFEHRPSVEGLVLLGGASSCQGRAVLDEYSDLDAAVFISIPAATPWVGQQNSVRTFLNQSQNLLPPWLPPFQLAIPCPGTKAGEISLDLHQLIVELEEDDARVWDEGCRQAYSETGEIIFDRSGRVGRIIARKTEWDEDEAWRTLIRVIGQIYWCGCVNPPRQLARGLPDHAHDLLNEALDGIIHVAYIANRRYRPHRKWRLRESFSLPSLPPRFKERVLEALVIRDLEPAHVGSRIHLVTDLITDVTELASRFWELPEDCYNAACQFSYDDRQLRRPTDQATNRPRSKAEGRSNIQ